MKLYKTIFGGLLVAPTLLPLMALADDIHCPPNLGEREVDGNVLIAAPCRLDGTTVKGSVLLYAGGSLAAVDATIRGNIQAENADFIDVENTEVIGSIQLDNMVGDVSNVRSSRIDGSIQLKSSRSRLEIQANAVGADVQAFSNTGGVLVENNVIDGNLQCKENSPAPVGGNNRVSGNKEDQCESLVPEGGAPAGASAVGTSASDATDGAGGAGALGPAALFLFLSYRIASQMRRRAPGSARHSSSVNSVSTTSRRNTLAEHTCSTGGRALCRQTAASLCFYWKTGFFHLTGMVRAIGMVRTRVR
jgi:hypothetical protein